MIRDTKGIFFAIDAAIALTFLAVGVLFIFLTFIGEPVQQQAALYSTDLLAFFRDTRVVDVKQEWLMNMYCVDAPLCTHNLTRPDQTLLSTFAKLASEGKLETAQYIAGRLGNGLVQQQFGWNLSIEALDAPPLVLAHGTGAAGVTERIATRSLVYYVADDHTLGGPYVAQVIVWQ